MYKHAYFDTEPMLLDGEDADPSGQAALQARDAALADGSAALQARQASHAEASTSSGDSRAERLTSLTIEAVRDTVSAFYSGMPKSCANCGAELPVIRRCVFFLLYLLLRTAAVWCQA